MARIFTSRAILLLPIKSSEAGAGVVRADVVAVQVKTIPHRDVIVCIPKTQSMKQKHPMQESR